MVYVKDSVTEAMGAAWFKLQNVDAANIPAFLDRRLDAKVDVYKRQAEMIAVDSGLGYLVIDARNSGKRYDLVVAAMLTIGLIGLALDLGFRRLRDIRSVRWGFRDES